jgi:GNAT superfamily N-acetyltransferase
MRIERKPNLTESEKETIRRLWNAEYPENLRYASAAEFDEFLNKQTKRRHFLLFDENGNLKGWLMTFTRDSERWFSVIIDTGEQKKGYGTALLNEVKRHEGDINGWVVGHDDYLKANGEKYRSPLEFYRKNGFAVLDDIKLEKKDFDAVKINWKKMPNG